MLDYIIVGGGLAGIAFAEMLRKNDQSFKVIDGRFPSASAVAGGIYNPVVLKRLKSVDNATQYMEAMISFFDGFSEHFKVDFRHPMTILRRLSSVEEQNDWFAVCDKIPYLIPKVITTGIHGIDAPYGFGEVAGTGYLETAAFIRFYQGYLQERGLFRTDEFLYSELNLFEDHLEYMDLQAKRIVFAEGFHVRNNPFFNYLPISGTKGEVLIVKIPDLELEQMIKAGVFIMPLGNHLFKVGSTYNWKDQSDIPTAAAKEELLEKLTEILQLPFDVIDHYAGVRPTVRDRKPLVGTHRDHPNIHILNGLGSRGVMLAPACAEALYHLVNSNIKLPPAIDVRRFDSLMPPQDRS